MDSLAIFGVRVMYIVFYILLFPVYFLNKKDFQKKIKQNMFYRSWLVRYIEKHPVAYELSMLVQNFPHPTCVYNILPEIHGRVLQVGCGTGLLNKYLKKHKVDVDIYNLDINEKHMQYALRHGRIDNYTCSGIYHTDFPESFFDCIIFARSFHHIKFHDKTFRECMRLLKPGGRILILDIATIYQNEEMQSESSCGYMANSSIDGLIWRFSEQELRRRLEKYLPERLNLKQMICKRQIHITNYNLKYPQMDVCAEIVKLYENEKGE